MATVQDIVLGLLAENGWSPKQLAERSGINQLTINALVADGSLPRKAEHREYLRVVVGLDRKAWAAALMESCELPIIPDDSAPLQVLIAHHMFLQGLTERGLSKLSGIPYGTVLGVVRKGAIPRGNSLNKIGDALGLEPSLVAAALQRSGGNPDNLPGLPAEDSLEEGLAPLVAKRIRSLGLSIGSYAEKLAVGYLQLSRFLDSGTPPEDSTLLTALRADLGLDEQQFTVAVESGQFQPKPGTVSARKGEPPPDASQLQQALIRYMNSRKMTIKALSEQLELSQITVSRLVKQGVRPSRSRTHQQLRELLGLSEEEYGDLLADKLEQPPTTNRRPISEALTPKKSPRSKQTPDHESTAALIAKSKTRGASENDDFEASSCADMSDAEVMALLKRLDASQRQSLMSFLHRLDA